MARWRGRDSNRDSDNPKIDLRRATADDESVRGGGANVQYEIGLKQVPGNTRQYFSRHPEVWNPFELTVSKVVCMVDPRASLAVCSLCLVTLFLLLGFFSLLPCRVALSVAPHRSPSWPLCLSGRLSLRCASAPYLGPLWCVHLCFHDQISRACVDGWVQRFAHEHEHNLKNRMLFRSLGPMVPVPCSLPLAAGSPTDQEG